MNNLDRIKQRLEESLEKHKNRLLKTREKKISSTTIRTIKDKNKGKSNLHTAKIINVDKLLNNKQCNLPKKKSIENFKNSKLSSINKYVKKNECSYKSCEMKKKDIKLAYSKENRNKIKINQTVKKKDNYIKEGNIIGKINNSENKKNVENYVKKLKYDDDIIDANISDNNNDFQNISKEVSDNLNDLFRNFVNCKINNLYLISGERSNYPKNDVSLNEKELRDIENGDNDKSDYHDNEKKEKANVIEEINYRENEIIDNKNDLKNIKSHFNDKGTYENNLKKLLEIEKNMKDKIRHFEEQKGNPTNEDSTLCCVLSSNGKSIQKISTESSNQLTYINSSKDSVLVNISSSLSIVNSNEEKKSVSDSVELFTTQKNIYVCNYYKKKTNKKKNLNPNALIENYKNGHFTNAEYIDSIDEHSNSFKKLLINKHINMEKKRRKKKKKKKSFDYLVNENSDINYKMDVSKENQLLENNRTYIETSEDTDNDDTEDDEIRQEEDYEKKKNNICGNKQYVKHFDNIKKRIFYFPRNISINKYKTLKRNECKNDFYNLINENIINDKDTFNNECVPIHLNKKKKKKIVIYNSNNLNYKSDISNSSVKGNCNNDYRYDINLNCVNETNDNIKRCQKKLLKKQMMMLHYHTNPLAYNVKDIIKRKNKVYKNIDKNSVLKKTKYELSSYIASSNAYISNYNLYDEYIISSNDIKRNISNNENYINSKECINSNILKYMNNYYSNPCSHKVDYLCDYDNKRNFIKEQIEKWKRKKIPSYLKKNSHYFKSVLSNIYNDKNNLTLEHSNDLLKNTQKLFLSNEYMFKNNIISSTLEREKKKKMIEKKSNDHLNDLNNLKCENTLNIKNSSLNSNKENNSYSNSVLSTEGKDQHDISTNCFICSFPIHKNEKKYFLKKDSVSGSLKFDMIKKRLKEKDEVKYKEKRYKNEYQKNKNKIKNYEDIYDNKEKNKKESEKEQSECGCEYKSENEKEKYFNNRHNKKSKNEDNAENIKKKCKNINIKKEKIEKIGDIKLINNKKREIEDNKNTLVSTLPSNNFTYNLNFCNYIKKLNKIKKNYNEVNFTKKYIKKNSINKKKRSASYDSNKNFLHSLKNYDTEHYEKEKNNKYNEMKLIMDKIYVEKKKKKIINYIKSMYLLCRDPLINLESNIYNHTRENSFKNSNSICHSNIINYMIKELHTLKNKEESDKEKYNEKIDKEKNEEEIDKNKNEEEMDKEKNEEEIDKEKNEEEIDKEKNEEEINYNKKLNSNKKNVENFISAKIPYLNNNGNAKYNFLRKETENEMNSTINDINNSISLINDNKEKENLLEKKNDYFNEDKKNLNEKKNKTNLKINSNVLKKILKMKIESMKNDNNRKVNEENKMELNSFNAKEILELPKEILSYDEGIELKNYEKNNIKEKNVIISSSNNNDINYKVVETGSNNSDDEINFDKSSNNNNKINSSNHITSIDNFFNSANNTDTFYKTIKKSSEMLNNNNIYDNNISRVNIKENNNIKYYDNVVNTRNKNNNNNSVNIKNNSNCSSDNVNNNEFVIDTNKKYDSKNSNCKNNSNENASNSDEINDIMFESNSKIDVLDFNESYYCRYLKNMENNDVYPNSEEPITKDDKSKLMKAYLNNKRKNKNSEKYTLKYNIEFFKLAKFFCEDYNLFSNYLKEMDYNLSKSGDDLDKTAFSIIKLFSLRNGINEKNSRKDSNENVYQSINTYIKKKNNVLKYNEKNINTHVNCKSNEIINKFNNKKKFIKDSIFLTRTKMNENLFLKKNNSITLSESINKNKLIKSNFDQNNNKMNYFINNKNKCINEYLMNNKAKLFLYQQPININYTEKNNTFSRSSSFKFVNENEHSSCSKNCYISRQSTSTKKKNSLLKTSALIEKYEKLKYK
ncbi:conserved Plasmodium protein, unknown function [Plasmodium relictum]|uniref:Uncharacterized protein n=1 Tax=Plasmodium relictum TaxID=85471 RepID=A0A1J1H2G8_PLARL|nr:conserved Plasmodium protein, unknown function [Plasmodium relictum]CRG99052.1 conserved Plasmodium protein, unknown function [Plasmodium relictum]